MESEPGIHLTVRGAMPLPMFLWAVVAAQTPTDAQKELAYRATRSFGSVVGEAGDVDLDHVPDFVVGDPEGGSDGVAARFWILSGADGHTIRKFDLPPPSASEPAHRGSASRLHGGVDVDRDGIPDLLIMEQPYTDPEPGAVTLVSGKTGSLIRRWTARGSHSADLDWARFVGDVDGDGVSDIGILSMEPERHEAALTIYSGASGTAIRSFSVQNNCGVNVGGWLPVEQEKLNSFPDFVVVLRGAGACAPSVRTYSGVTGKLKWEHTAAEKSSREGFNALALWSDFNRDGRREIAVQLGQEVHALSGTTGDILLSCSTPPNPEYGSRYGGAIVSIGDVNHDGNSEIAFADTESDQGYGCVVVKSGADGSDLWVAKPRDLVGPEHAENVYHLGYQLAPIGDVTGDGVEDLVAGTWAGSAGGPGRALVLSGKDGSLVFELGRKGMDVEVLRARRAGSGPR